LTDCPKRSIGLALEKPEARGVLHELIKSSDVFLTNFLPSARAKLGIEVEDVRAVRPDIIYAVGTGFGHSGPEADKGGYDSTAFWARGGSADSATQPAAEWVTQQPVGAYGDNIGGMTIAAGIAAALFARDRTGAAPTVDVSLLGVGAWAAQLNVNLALLSGGPLSKVGPRTARASNPLTGLYRTSDDRAPTRRRSGCRRRCSAPTRRARWAWHAGNHPERTGERRRMSPVSCCSPPWAWASRRRSSPTPRRAPAWRTAPPGSASRLPQGVLGKLPEADVQRIARDNALELLGISPG
jgi:crotonobetainyl-CoA:carnitine CoA-transferase CaiB-like acyl-CoA transferase